MRGPLHLLPQELVPDRVELVREHGRLVADQIMEAHTSLPHFTIVVLSGLREDRAKFLVGKDNFRSACSKLSAMYALYFGRQAALQNEPSSFFEQQGMKPLNLTMEHYYAAGEYAD